MSNCLENGTSENCHPDTRKLRSSSPQLKADSLRRAWQQPFMPTLRASHGRVKINVFLMTYLATHLGGRVDGL